MASAEYQGCPPRVVRGSAAHASIASAVNQTVRLPRWRRLASYAGQFVTLCCLPRDVVAAVLVQLEGQGGYPGSAEGALPYATQLPSTNRPIHAPRWLSTADVKTL